MQPCNGKFTRWNGTIGTWRMCDGQQGLVRPNAAHGDHSQGQGATCDIECLPLKEGLKTSSAKFFWVHSGAQLGNYQRYRDGTVCLFVEEWTALEIDL